MKNRQMRPSKIVKIQVMLPKILILINNNNNNHNKNPPNKTNN